MTCITGFYDVHGRVEVDETNPVSSTCVRTYANAPDAVALTRDGGYVGEVATAASRMLPTLHTVMWDANTTRVSRVDEVRYEGDPQISHRIARRNTNFDAFWRCERRRCAPFASPVEDVLVGVVWDYTDSPDHHHYMHSLGQREYLSTA